MADSDSEPELDTSSLSASTLLALQAHLDEKKTGAEAASRSGEDSDAWYHSEDFGFSQFWYDEETSETLARELEHEWGRILSFLGVDMPPGFAPEPFRDGNQKYASSGGGAAWL